MEIGLQCVPNRHCLRVRYRTSRLRGYGSGTGPLDTDSRGPVPDPEPRLWGLSRGPVVCETTTDKSRDTGPYAIPDAIFDPQRELTEKDCREWKLTTVDSQERSTWRSSVRSAIYLHVYVVTSILPTKTHVEFVRHLWSSKGNQSVFTVMRHTIQTIKFIQKVYK